jgi:hypothetical protein
VRDSLVRGQVSSSYTLIDQWLTLAISRYFFKAGRKTAMRRVFQQYIMDEMYLLQKTRVVHAISPLPAKVRQTIDRINALCNSLAHSLFPQDRRQYAAHRRVIYNDVDIFSMKGVERLTFDVADVLDVLKERTMGKVLAASEPDWNEFTDVVAD